jgi:voltage-gated potassium channel
MFNERFEPYSNDTELSTWQKRRFDTYQFIFKQETKSSKCFSLFITVIILIAVSSSCLETLKAYRDLIIWDIIEFVCCSIFIIEYIIKIIIVDNKIKYIKSFCHFVDIVSIIPIFFTFQESSETSNIVSFFKVLKLFRIVKILSNKSFKVYTQLMTETMAKSIYGLKLMMMLIVIAVIFSSSNLYQLEKGVR